MEHIDISIRPVHQCINIFFNWRDEFFYFFLRIFPDGIAVWKVYYKEEIQGM